MRHFFKLHLPVCCLLIGVVGILLGVVGSSSVVAHPSAFPVTYQQTDSTKKEKKPFFQRFKIRQNKAERDSINHAALINEINGIIEAKLTAAQNENAQKRDSAIAAIKALEEKLTAISADLSDTSQADEQTAALMEVLQELSASMENPTVEMDVDQEVAAIVARKTKLAELNSLPKRCRDTTDVSYNVKLKNDSTALVCRACQRHSHEVWGYHPYWITEAQSAGYNYRLLTALLYFLDGIDANTGDFKSTRDWKTSPVIDSALVAGCQVLLAVAEKEAASLSRLLGNTKVEDALIENLLFLVESRGANGVNINFENLPKSKSDDYVAFILKLSEVFIRTNPDYSVSITVPPVDPDNIYQTNKIALYLDRIVIIGYSYSSKESKNSGPLAPLKNGKQLQFGSLEESVEFYKTKVPDSTKLLLGLPYYGLQWQTETAKPGSPTLEKGKVVFYRDLKPGYDTLTPIFVEDIGATYYVIDDDDKISQCWIDDVQSLSAKYDFVQKSGIGGVSLWALGYDAGRDDLWELMADKFVFADTIILDTIQSKVIHATDTTESLWSRIKSAIAAPFENIGYFFEAIYDPVNNDTKEVELFLLIVALITGLAGIAIALFMWYKILETGPDWKRKRLCSVLATLCFCCSLVCLMLYAHVNQDLYVNDSKMSAIELVSALIVGIIFGMIIFRFLGKAFFKSGKLP